MNVLVTGGTGFVGSHVSRQLQAGGHAVRLLVRDEDKARKFFISLGEPVPELVRGDVTDAASVRAAMAGCEGVVHAAAGTPLRAGSVEDMFAVNVGGVKTVVDAALALGLERIVCVSSITAIFNEDAARVTPDAPPAPSRLPYGQSKVEAELYLRERQAEGAPIAIVYPAGVIGPDDPGFSDTCAALRHRIVNGFRIFGDGGIQHIDVRDLAAFICSLVTAGGAGRFLLPGVYLKWTELADVVEDASGRPLKRIPASGWKLRLVGRAMDVVRKFRRIDSPISAETMRYATLWPDIPNTPEFEARGLGLRSPRRTFADTLDWMVAAGHLDAAHCPAVAARRAAAE
ncbi:MAG: NAD-dependent epimerase/dehydratase family protein [Halioglobus sp.]|nr:NAD-dependent epimerase/dehydratase family protein [Halioglobus sp.]